MLSPVALFLILLIIGIAAGLLFDRFAGPGWLSRQMAGQNRLMVTSALVGIAGSFIGYYIFILIGVVRHCRAAGRHSRSRRGAVGLADGEIIHRAGTSIGGAHLRPPCARQLSSARCLTMALASQMPPPTTTTRMTSRTMLAIRRSRGVST